LFIAAITVPFDIRDLFQDKRFDLKTIPVLIGERKAYIVCQILLFAYLTLLVLFTKNLDTNFFALMLSILVTGWLILKAEWERDEYYYFLYLDGTMIIQFMFLLLAQSVF
jgi:4-hydroxybenzoate polyprenyltransferase